MMSPESESRFQSLVASRKPWMSLEQAFHVDPDVYYLDIKRLWRKQWLFAAHTCELKNPGDFVTYNLDSDSLILVRTEKGDIRAFHNTCRHRGSRLCLNSQGHAKRFVCSYHQWSYDNEGKLLTCNGIDSEVNKSLYSLVPAPCRVTGGLIFVSLSDSPPPFEEANKVIADHLRYQGMDRAKVAIKKDYVIEANWKLIWENNRECYHCPVGHPQYDRATYDTRWTGDQNSRDEIDKITAKYKQKWRDLGLETKTYLFPDGQWYRANRAPLAKGYITESMDGKPVAPLMGDFTDRDLGAARITTLPNYWNHACSDHVVSTRLTPLGPKKTEAQVTWLVHEDAREGVDYDLEKLLPFWQLTSEQDWRLCENNQLGVNSSRYRPGPYSKEKEHLVERFMQWYIHQVGQQVGQQAGQTH